MLYLLEINGGIFLFMSIIYILIVNLYGLSQSVTRTWGLWCIPLFSRSTQREVDVGKFTWYILPPFNGLPIGKKGVLYFFPSETITSAQT